MTPTGRCTKCGQVYYGWALKDPVYRKCDCGGWIVVEKPVTIGDLLASIGETLREA